MNYFEWHMFLLREVVAIGLIVFFFRPLHSLSDRFWSKNNRYRSRLDERLALVALNLIIVAVIAVVTLELITYNDK